MTDEARKRILALEDYDQLGSGFNIAMKDLEIRGAGNILGPEQSGFITDIGFDMYQKILNEALALSFPVFVTIPANNNQRKDAISKTCEYIRKKGVKEFRYYLPIEIENDKTPKTWVDKLI